MAEKIVYKKPDSLTDKIFSYCWGCGHSTVHKIIAELIDELGMREKTIAVAPVGCAVFAYDFWNFDTTEAAHGRAPVVATAIKRVHPGHLVFSYQGDGDLASIGMAEIIHTANRGENLTIIFINNTNYGMTGGQMAPTTLIGQKTTTSPAGRNIKQNGYPIKMSEMLAQFESVKYVERVKVTNAASVIKAKKAIKKGFLNQLNGTGFSFIEVLSACQANWRMEPLAAKAHIDGVISKYYPVGLIKDIK
jgi:2-oxoglutarate ferredoxin oxidoreductase subunit beta